MNFTDELWLKLEPIFQRIIVHPFVTGLADGSLDEAAFRHYVIQDALYLKEFGRALALLAGQAESSQDLLLFAEHARMNTFVELSVLHLFLSHWGLDADFLATVEPAPACVLYTSYFLKVAHSRPFHEILGALLSCYWLYWKVGQVLLAKPKSYNPLYCKWIETYGGEAYARMVEEVLVVVNRIGENLSLAERERVVGHVLITAKMEYCFWDMGYQQAVWPL